MTRDEFIEKVAKAIAIADISSTAKSHPNITFEKLSIAAALVTASGGHAEMAKAAINTIFDALKEPTEGMVEAGNEYGAFIGAYGIWQAMLNASPLAK